MPTLTIARGLPGSGKTYWAAQQVAIWGGAVARVSRDDIRERMFGALGKTRFDHATEQAVTVAQQAAVRALLATGRDVIVDDTNLRLRFARAWADLAVEEGVDFTVVDFTDVALDVCIERDARRHDSVGEAVIREMHDRFLRGKTLPPVTPTKAATPAVRPYVRPEPDTLPTAWVVDVDGTVALMVPGGRSPYDWHRVGEDVPNEPVVSLVRALWAAGHRIIFLSGRDAVCRDETEKWLAEHVLYPEILHMRPEGDMRKDSIVKDELFEARVRGHYDVIGVVDDRDQVVRLWRSKGLACAQVAEGKF